MDILQQCAKEFEHLIPYQYHIVIGRKGKLLEFTISFEPPDFHHLAGLHKLRDNVRFQTGKRADIMKEILTCRLTLSHAQQSIYFPQMEPRLLPLSMLESYLDSNQIIFRYNSKANNFSSIQADYLLQNNQKDIPIYLFLTKRSGQNTHVCRTLFPQDKKDYTQGQPRYTLLKKEKHNLLTGTSIIQYDRLSPINLKREKN